MGRVVVTEYISVDGVIEAPSGVDRFERAGWTDPFVRGPEGDQFKLEEALAADALLFGRVTYDAFAPVWPHVQGEVADKLNAMPKYVVSSTLEHPRWHNTTVLRGDLVGDVLQLKQRYAGDILIYGSAQLAQALIEHDLVDALNLQMYPVIVGAGKRLFAGASAIKRLRLARAQTVGDGVHILIYERVT